MPQRTALHVTVCRPMRQVLAIALLLAATLARSGPFEDGLAARARGDFATAFSTFKQLASTGDARSQFQLSLLYASGKGVKPNPKNAMYWLRQAAIHGDVQAQSNLGVAFNRARGEPQDPIKAYAWSSMASASGDTVATTNRDVAARRLSLAQIEQAKALARLCLQGDFKPCL